MTMLDIFAVAFYSLVMFWLFLCAVMRAIDEEREILRRRKLWR